MMSSCCTFLLNRRKAFSSGSPSCTRTSAKKSHLQTCHGASLITRETLDRWPNKAALSLVILFWFVRIPLVIALHTPAGPDLERFFGLSGPIRRPRQTPPRTRRQGPRPHPRIRPELPGLHGDLFKGACRRQLLILTDAQNSIHCKYNRRSETEVYCMA